LKSIGRRPEIILDKPVAIKFGSTCHRGGVESCTTARVHVFSVSLMIG
jgi:hypothetical protein